MWDFDAGAAGSSPADQMCGADTGSEPGGDFERPVDPHGSEVEVQLVEEESVPAHGQSESFRANSCQYVLEKVGGGGGGGGGGGMRAAKKLRVVGCDEGEEEEASMINQQKAIDVEVVDATAEEEEEEEKKKGEALRQAAGSYEDPVVCL